MKEFIVTTDLDDASDTNVYTSYHLAKMLDLKPKLYFVDTISPMIEKIFHPPSIHTNYMKDTIWRKEYEVIALERISQQLERLSLKKEEFEFEVFEGSISQGVNNLKQHDQLEVISIGASDHSEIHRLFFNTFAEKVFFNLGKDSFVVKKKDAHFKHVYMLISPMENHDRIVVKTVELLQKIKTKLHILCISNVEFLGLDLEAFPNAPDSLELQRKSSETQYKKTELMLRMLESNFRKKGIDVEHTVHVTLNKENGPSLNKLLHEIHPDLVIMSPKTHFLNHFSLGSITHYIIKRNDCNFYLVQ